MNIYAIELYGNRIGLRAAKNLEEARQAAYEEEGTANVRRVRIATQDDISWVRSMGGYVPEEVES